ncbi:MAG: PorT family protein [Chitinophagaceae bacterium]|nr:PorT family protein [Chitinophagaceae bacterium]
MKQLVLTIVIISATLIVATGQNVNVGFSAGATISNYRSKVDGNDESGKSKAGLTIGILLDLPTGTNFSFQPALNFVQKGTKEEQTYGNTTEKTKLTISSIELLLNFLYNSNSNNGIFFIGAGPSFGYNTSGKLSYDDGTNSDSEKIKIGNDPLNDFIKGLDLGANVLAGFRFPNGLFFSTSYNAGLKNLFPGGSSDGTLKSHYFSIKLGMMLKHNAIK